jgi:hypothetical protein
LYYVPGVFLRINKLCAKKTALCKQCHEKEAEMTSFECYNMRVANPRASFVFYDNFLKIADGAEGNLEAFATSAVEAFTLLCLENNKQDWLHHLQTQFWHPAIAMSFCTHSSAICIPSYGKFMVQLWHTSENTSTLVFP